MDQSLDNAGLFLYLKIGNGCRRFRTCGNWQALKNVVPDVVPKTGISAFSKSRIL